ncbi:MAG: hypothetical protein CMP50_03690 [Flavobacteriales bacterium]|nr:hypothetical protein [Flavobacteriales bacterium]
MKVAFDAKRAYNNITGLGNYSRSVINSVSKLRKKDTFFLATPTINQRIYNIKKSNIELIQPNKFTNKHFWRFKGINKQLNSEKIDLYHGLSNEIPYNLKIKSIVTVHDLLFLKYPEFYNYLDRYIYTFKSKIACQQSNQIIATSLQTKNDIINYFQINENKIKVIYQSCQNEFIDKSNDDILKSTIKEKLKKPFLLFVGSIEKRKNLLFLLKAINKINNIHLICIGRKGDAYNKVLSYITKNKLEKKITFLSIYNTNTLATIYRLSRGLIYPSIDEGFGIPIIEAMYSKIPVITSDKPIFKEVGGSNSYYFESGKLDSLISAIKEIWTDSNDRSKRIEKNFNYVQKFNETQQAEKIVNLYKHLI